MSLTIALSPYPNQLVATTEHGFETRISLDVAGLRLLHQLLQKQATEKRIVGYERREGIGDWHYILAEWERLGPTGAGKQKKDRYASETERAEIKARIFTERGLELEPL